MKQKTAEKGAIKKPWHKTNIGENKVIKDIGLRYVKCKIEMTENKEEEKPGVGRTKTDINVDAHQETLKIQEISLMTMKKYG
jgi:hypothetical protein